MSEIKNKAATANDYHNAIVDAVSYWLGYQFKIGRSKLIHEASLRYPIADVLTAKGKNIERIALEQPHPVFKNRRIDVAILREENKKIADDDDVSYLVEDAFELKIAKSTTAKEYGDEHQRIFDDIIRLAYCNHREKNIRCHFVICGEYEDFKAFFVGQKSQPTTDFRGKTLVPVRNPLNSKREAKENDKAHWESSGLYKDWFDFRIGGEKLKTFQTIDHAEWGLASFNRNYQLKNDSNIKTLHNELTIKTTCLAITSHGLETNRTHAVGIWQVSMIEAK